MNERNEKWLDEQLKKTIDSGKVEFDGEQWKQKYSAEYQKLISRARTRPNVQRFSLAHPLIRIAAVIAIAALVVLFMSRRPGHVEPVVFEKSRAISGEDAVYAVPVACVSSGRFGRGG